MMFSPTTVNNMLSPPLPTAGTSSAQSPNSAQLWSEIAQMMDPGMMSAIPGLHLSTALPEDARDAVRKIGEGEEDRDRKQGGGPGAGGAEDVRLVGDLVGPSPPVSATELGGGVKEGPRAEVERRKLVDENEDHENSESDEDEDEDESYDAVLQSVVVALPHSPMTIPIIPRVIEPLRTVGKPRLLNVNGLTGVEQARSKEKAGGDVALELDKQKVSGLPTLDDRDSIRSSTATIIPRGLRDPTAPSGMNGQGAPSRLNHHHRPPSMKLVISNGIVRPEMPFAGNENGVRVESSTVATMGTAESGLTEGAEGGGNITSSSSSTPYLAYYMDDGTPSPLPSPGSALGSPLRDIDTDEEGGSGSGGGRFGFGFGSESTPNSSLSGIYGERRFGYDYDDEYQLGYRGGDGGGAGRRTLDVGNEGVGGEDDLNIDYSEEYSAPGGAKGGDNSQTRVLPLTTPIITLNDGQSPPNGDHGDKMMMNKPLNGLGPAISTSINTFDLVSPSLSPAPSPFQQRYYGWVSTLVAPLSEFIDEAVDPRDHYLDLTEIAEGESGSVYAARVNKSNARKLKLGEVVRMQDLDDLGLADDDHDDPGGDDDKGKNGGGGENEEQMKLVAIKSIALVPSGTPKLVDLEKELKLMKGLWHSQVLSVDAVYVDLVEDSVWLRMELMERSLADVIVLVDSGLVLQERTIARFASDVSFVFWVLVSGVC
jgi:hypothetical protein